MSRPYGVSPQDLRETMLFRRYHATRDPRLRELLVERHLGLAAQVAGRYRRASLSYDDALQLARIGLLKAIDRFDPDHGASFSSFAVPTMVGELKRFLRDHGWAVRPPRPVQERAAQVEHAAERLGGRLGRAPTARELSAETGLTLEDVLESLAAGDCRRSIPLDTPVSDGAEDTLADRLGCEDPRLSQVEDSVIADQLLGQLTARDEVVLRLRFERDLTQLEIGAVVGCSQMQVSRIIRGALEQLETSAADERSELLAGV